MAPFLPFVTTPPFLTLTFSVRHRLWVLRESAYCKGAIGRCIDLVDTTQFLLLTRALSAEFLVHFASPSFPTPSQRSQRAGTLNLAHLFPAGTENTMFRWSSASVKDLSSPGQLCVLPWAVQSFTLVQEEGCILKVRSIFRAGLHPEHYKWHLNPERSGISCYTQTMSTCASKNGPSNLSSPWGRWRLV